mgnify:CR=1 FL=1
MLNFIVGWCIIQLYDRYEVERWLYNKILKTGEERD